MYNPSEWGDKLSKAVASMQAPTEAFGNYARELSDQMISWLAQAMMVPAKYWETRQRVTIPEIPFLYVQPMQVGVSMHQDIDITIEGERIRGWLIGLYRSRHALVIEHRNHRAVYYEIPSWQWQRVQDALLSEIVPQLTIAQIKTEYVLKERKND